VIVAGETKVRAGKTLFCDEAEVKRDLQQAAERAWARMKNLEEISPLSIPRHPMCACHRP
jgi:hypothetical protein